MTSNDGGILTQLEAITGPIITIFIVLRMTLGAL